MSFQEKLNELTYVDDIVYVTINNAATGTVRSAQKYYIVYNIEKIIFE